MRSKFYGSIFSIYSSDLASLPIHPIHPILVFLGHLFGHAEVKALNGKTFQ